MLRLRSPFACGALVALAVTLGPAGHAAARSGQPPVRPGATTQPPTVVGMDPGLVRDFIDRVMQYVALHEKIEDALPKLPEEATPQQIDANQRAFAAQLAASRRTARQGDIFTPAMQTYVRRLLARVLGGPNGARLRAAIMDENTVGIRLRVNQRYPDAVPLTTMPVEVLEALPKLPEELEYRFVGDQLILLDPHAHVVVDFIPDALPGRGGKPRDAK